MAKRLSTTDVLQAAAAGADAAEVYEQEASAIPVVFRAGELDAVKVTESRGRAVRVVRRGRLGYATTTDFDDAKTVVTNAAQAARLGDAVAVDFPRGVPADGVAVYDEALARLTERDLISRGEEVVARVKAFNPRLDLFVNVYRETEKVRVVNTAGLDARERRTYGYIVAAAMDAREGDIFTLIDFCFSRRADALDAAVLADRLVARLKLAARQAQVPGGRMPVVFAKLGAMTLFLPLFNGFNGRQVFLGTSPLKGRLGERAFDRRFNLVDDGRLPYGTRSGAFDDEGSPAAERTLVEDGVVRSFLYDLKTARQAGAASTGNGFRSNPSGRGYHLRPDVAPSTFRVRPGDTPLAAVLGGLEEALLVEQVMGLGTAGNPLTGDFSNTVATGFLVRRGEIVGRVKNTMVAGNVYELLAHALVAVGDQTEVVDDVVMSPPLVLDGVTVVSG